MFPDNKAVQPCLALQADIRRAISIDSPAALTKFADQKKTDLSNEHYEWLQFAVARRRPTITVTTTPPLPFPNCNCHRKPTPRHRRTP